MSTAPTQHELTLDVPRVLLFGHRGAGKSALVGALLQAGETQGETLRGEVVHSSVDLPRIRDAVYSGNKLDPYKTDLVSYTIRLRPWRVLTKPVGDPLTVVLDDCDGVAAEALLEHPEPITQRAPGSPIARAVVETDALVLLVDGASTDDELNEAFKDFDVFLNVVHRAKTDARVVGGFPVYLVLTQCDRLARAGDTLGEWDARVADRVENAWRAFDAHLKDADPDDSTPSPFLSFGSVDLTVFAAAIRRPSLPGSTAPTHHPYQVAELFRECFAQARAYHERARASEGRLKWTVRLALSAVVVLFLSLAMVALFPPQPTGTELADRVRLYLASEPPAAVRLADREIERNRTTLLRFQTDAAYVTLEPELREFVESRVKEIESYKSYRAKLAKLVEHKLTPGELRTIRDLTRTRDALRIGELAPPPLYDWHETATVRLRDKWLADCAAIESTESLLVERYRGYDIAATAHVMKRPFDAAWLAAFDALMTRADQPQFPLDDPLPGSPSNDHTRSAAVRYRDVNDYDEVDHTRRAWERTRDRVAHMRDLADALGMIAAPDRPEPVLALPDVGTIDPAARCAALRRAYPRQTESYEAWEVWHFNPAGADLAARLNDSFDAGTRHLKKLMTAPDTVAGWKALATSLDEPKFRDWGKLLHLLARLQRARLRDPVPPDPVAELGEFLTDLDTKVFELNPTGFELSIPLDLTAGLDSVEPVGPFTITVTHGNSVQATKFAVGKGELRVVRRANKDVQVMVYRLASEGNTRLAYRAGNDLRATLPVKSGTNMLEFRWETGGSETFRFDRLSRTPRLTTASGGIDPAPGVTLTPTNTNAIPTLPTLLAK